ncbi:MAG: hypothetical protein CNIPEHKO_00495 [Anaerolineales bacterium]|nr:hypothetical protein [Anaerolineae bacterium]MBL8106253.1 hypothetical protein [Anaerolineales bacterium]MBV6400212.1 hypothetical protein [Anaerolineales bacterium]MCC7187282.1 hypothetical protein [Anaerolineales bacterium]HQU37924.1 hypothetical protein [Anaerolineales bacterium]
MLTQYDEKGKIFTEVVTKIPVRATIQTVKHQIRGMVHVRREERIKDELNRGEGFIALTDATVLNEDGTVMYKTPFLAVKREHIIWVLPEPVEEGEA